MDTKSRTSLRQPKVFPLAVTTALFERSGYYVLAFFIVLYAESQFGYSDNAAYNLSGILNALVFLTPALGGYIADNIVGIRRTMLLGILLEGAGLTLVALPNIYSFYLGLSLVVIGVGFFKTGPTDLLARGYADNDPRIDRGFTLYYMAMNIGSFCSPIVVGILKQRWGWVAAFGFSAAALYINILAYSLLIHRAKEVDAKAGDKKLNLSLILLLIGGIIIGSGASVALLSFSTIAHVFFFVATALLLLYFGYEISRSPKRERWEILACLALIVMGMVFFIMYFQYYMSITLFIKRSVRHSLFGLHVPTATLLALNPFWIIVLSPLLVWTYGFISRKRGKDLAITTKFPLGVFITSLCFLLLKFGTYFADGNWKISSWWLIGAIFLYSLGELLVSALGVAMVTRIAPRRMYGVMMGAWYLIAAALASSISSTVASVANIPKTMHDPHLILNIYGRFFLELGVAGLIATMFAFLVAPYIKRIAHID